MKYLAWVSALLFNGLFFTLVLGCSNETPQIVGDGESLARPVGIDDEVTLSVFKRPTCQCCSKWIHHAEAFDFKVTTYHPDDVSLVKEKYEVPLGYHSCHTSVARNGVVFEGHIPAKYMRQYLMKRPDDTIGLTVPGMPLGSPGMNVGTRFTPYKVFLIHTDGTVSVYADIKSYEDQYDIN